VRAKAETTATAELVLRREGRRSWWPSRAWRIERDGVFLTRLRRGGEHRLTIPSGAMTLIAWAGDEGSLPLHVVAIPSGRVVVEAMTIRRAAALGLVEPGFAPDPLLLREIR
jgi:hypothetical protein